MDVPKSNHCFISIFVVAIVVVAGFSGVGSAQQTPNPTTSTNTTTATATGGQGMQVTNETTTGETTTRSSTPTPTPTPDANDEWRNATPVGADQTANGTLPVGDQDWYVFPVESSGHITVRLVAGNQTNMSGFLYDSGGNLLDSTYITPGEQLTLAGRAASAGDYYVFVRNEANTSGAYAFSVSVSESETPNNDSQLQPEAEIETTTGNGPGFSLLAGLVAIVDSGCLLFLARNSTRFE